MLRNEYRAFEHLWRSVIPASTPNRKESLMVMLTGYFDESYNQPNKSNPGLPLVYTVAGYISTVDKWDAFSVQWQEALDRHSLPPFSMKDFANPRSKTFAGWDSQEKQTFLAELHEILRPSYVRAFSTCVVLADYKTLSLARKFALGKPHHFAAIDCFKHIKEWAATIELNEPIRYVFEKGAVDEKPFKIWTEHIEEAEKVGYKIERVSFEPKSLQPLQAADMLAFETRKETGRRLLPASIGAKIRPSMWNLHDPERDEWYVVDRAAFKKIFKHPLMKTVTSKRFKATARAFRKVGHI